MLLAIAILTAAPPPHAPSVAGHSSGDRTSVVHDCLHARIEPRGIVFACADRGFYSDHLHWRKWHKFRAAGEGEFRGNDCRPDCAHGTVRERDGKIVLHGRKFCETVNRFVFTHARIRFDAQLFGRHRAVQGGLP